MSVNNNSNRPWNNESLHTTFEEADAIRSKLLRIWNSNPIHEGMEVKVKYLSSKSKFVVKTRLHPDFQPKKEQKNGKSSKRNKKNSNRTKLDASTSV